jgi:hypothetical protein
MRTFVHRAGSDERSEEDPDPGRKKLTINRCRFTVSEFIITTSPGPGSNQPRPGLSEHLVICVPRWKLLGEVRVDREVAPRIEFLLDVLPRFLRAWSPSELPQK